MSQKQDLNLKDGDDSKKFNKILVPEDSAKSRSEAIHKRMLKYRLIGQKNKLRMTNKQLDYNDQNINKDQIADSELLTQMMSLVNSQIMDPRSSWTQPSSPKAPMLFNSTSNNALIKTNNSNLLRNTQSGFINPINNQYASNQQQAMLMQNTQTSHTYSNLMNTQDNQENLHLQDTEDIKNPRIRKIRRFGDIDLEKSLNKIHFNEGNSQQEA
eukprot:403366178